MQKNRWRVPYKKILSLFLSLLMFMGVFAVLPATVSAREPLTGVTVALEGWTYGEPANAPAIVGVIHGAFVTYEYKNANGVYTTASETNAGTYAVRAIIDETEDYEAFTTPDAFYTIAKATPDAAVALEGWSYGEPINEPTISGTRGEGTVTNLYEHSGGLFLTEKQTDAGTWQVYAEISETTNYAEYETQHFEYVIEKADTTLTLTVAPESATYRDNVRLIANATKAGTEEYVQFPDGNVEFFDGDTSLGQITLADGQAVLTLTALGAGEHEFIVKYAGGTNYNASEDASTTYNIAKATQSPIYIENLDNSYVYGQLPFNIRAVGGTEVTAFTFTSDNEDVATVTDAGLVSITGAGQFNITLNKAGNENFNPISFTTAAPITVQPKPVIITGVTAADKVYDGNVVAAITGTPTIPVVGSDDVVVTLGSAAFNDAAAGFAKIVRFLEFKLDGTRADNYNLIAQPVNVQADITRKPITITASDATKVFGAEDPALTYTVDPALVTGDVLTAGSLKYTGANPGTYDIIQDVAFVNANYAIAFEKGTMTITIAEQEPVIIEGLNAGNVYKVGDTFQLNVSGGTGDTQITYASSDPTVANVSSSGLVTILAPGTFHIIITKAGATGYESSTFTTDLIKAFVPNQPLTLIEHMKYWVTQHAGYQWFQDLLVGKLNWTATAYEGLHTVWSWFLLIFGFGWLWLSF